MIENVISPVKMKVYRSKYLYSVTENAEGNMSAFICPNIGNTQAWILTKSWCKAVQTRWALSSHQGLLIVIDFLSFQQTEVQELFL